MTRNRADELGRTLEHLSALTPAPPVIVVDNGSTDHTADVVHHAAQQGRPVEIIRLSRNEGSAARNHGVRAASTPFVAFSDDDSWWGSGSLTTAETLFDENPRLGLIAARTLVGDEQAEDPFNAVLCRSPLTVSDNSPGVPILGFMACSAIVRRSAFLEADGFSPILQCYGEETLLAYDLAAAGWDLAYIPATVNHHHPSARRIPSRSRRNRELRNRLLTSWLRRPLGVCLHETVEAGKKVVGDPTYAPAVFEAVVRMPRVLAGRRRLPEHVERQAHLLRP